VSSGTLNPTILYIYTIPQRYINYIIIIIFFLLLFIIIIIIIIIIISLMYRAKIRCVSDP